MSKEREVEIVLQDIASKNKKELDSAKIVPLSPEWQFCTNGLYLFMSVAGGGKTRMVLKHILMADRLAKGGGYYSLIAVCSTSGELDRTMQTTLDAKVIKTPVVQVKDTQLMAFLERHLKRKKKYSAMLNYLRHKTVNETLQHSIDKHNFKFLAYDPKIKRSPIFADFQNKGMPYDVDVRKACLVEKIHKPKLISWILKKIEDYGVSRVICPLLVVLEDFAGHQLIERKETPLAKLMTKCRHNSTTFIICIQTVRYVIKTLRRQATDIVIWSGISEEDFYALFKEIAYSYPVSQLWEEYRRLPTQTSHLILNIKAHGYKFVPVNVD
jgi:hypothetical protein